MINDDQEESKEYHDLIPKIKKDTKERRSKILNSVLLGVRVDDVDPARVTGVGAASNQFNSIQFNSI